MKRCKWGKHWAEIEHVETYLDNIAYLAEVAEKVRKFKEVSGTFSHPEHFRVYFNPEPRKDSSREFSERWDNYVAYHGKGPSYLYGDLHFDLNYLPRTKLRVTVETKRVLDEEDGSTRREWTASLDEMTIHYWDKTPDKHIETIKLDLEGNKFDVNIGINHLIKFFQRAVEKSDPKRGLEPIPDPYGAQVEEMLDRFMEMFNAIQGAEKGDLQFSFDEFGDFKDSTSDTVVVDVDYQASIFNARRFREFVREHPYYYNRKVDARISVKDYRGRGDAPASWRLYRENGAFRIAITCWDGRELDTEVADSEDVRSHVYWHMIRELVPNNQDEAFKVSQYAADLYDAVEEELAAHNAGY